jgi:hypothetical protein
VSNLPDAAHENDLVLGHGNSDERHEVVLGGFDAIRSCYGSIDPLIRIDALKEAPKHGYQGLQLLHYALQDPDIDVRLTAYRFARQLNPQKQPPCDYRKLFKTMDSWNWDASDPEVQILKLARKSDLPESQKGYMDDGLTWVTQTINQLIERKDQPGFQQLKAIYLGDDMQAEDAFSWRWDLRSSLTRDMWKLYRKSYLRMADFAPILDAFPNLEVLQVCGKFGDDHNGNYLCPLSPLRHTRLQSLIIEAADLGPGLLTALQTAELPELQYLELWLGRDDYWFGWDTHSVSFKDFVPLFEDLMSGKLFPNLRYLGLRSSEISGILLQSLEHFAFNGRVAAFDLSLGEFGVPQLISILENPALRRLDVLDLQNISVGWYGVDREDENRQNLLELIQSHPAHIVYGITSPELFIEHFEEQVRDREADGLTEEEIAEEVSPLEQDLSWPQKLDGLADLRFIALHE